jgi:hypothetical protein
MDLFTELGHRLIGCGFTIGEEGVHPGRNTQKLTQYREVISGQHSIDGADAPENFAGTIEVRPWQIDIVPAQSHEGADQRRQVVDTGAVAGWTQSQNCSAAAGRAGVCGQQLEKLIVFEDATGVSLHAPCLGYHSNSYMINISVTNSASASAS